MGYNQKNFQEGQILTSADMNEIESAILENEEKIAQHQESLEQHAAQISLNSGSIVTNANSITTNSNAIAAANERITNNSTAIASLTTSKLDKTITDDAFIGKTLYINDSKQVDFKTDAEIRPDKPSTVENNVDYYVGQAGKYIHYRGIDGKLEQIGTAEEGKLYRTTYGPTAGEVASGTAIPGVPEGTDSSYVFRLWEINAKDIASDPTPNLEPGTKWVVKNTHVIGADVERSLIYAKITNDVNIDSILWADVQSKKNRIYLQFQANSTNIEGTRNYELNYTITLRGNEIRSGTLLAQKEDHIIKIDVTNYLVSGRNLFEISFEDKIGSKDFLSHSINCIDFSAQATFEDQRTYDRAQENVFLEYTVKGSGLTKETCFQMFDKNGIEIYKKTETTISDQGNLTFLVPTDQPHGQYLIKCYSTSSVDSKSIQTDTFYFDLIIVENGNTTPIIGCAKRGEVVNIEQFNTVSLTYYVYDNNLSQPTTMIEILKNGAGFYDTLPEQQESREGRFSYKFNDIGDYTINIHTMSKKEEEWIITGTTSVLVKVGELDILAQRTALVSSSVILDFDATLSKDFESATEIVEGITKTYHRLKIGEERRKNEANDKNEIQPIYIRTNNDFDWINGGYKLDSDGVGYFIIKAGDRLTINSSLFGPTYASETGNANGIGSTGRSIKMVFRVQNSTNNKTPFFISYKEENKERELQPGQTSIGLLRSGIKMFPQEAYFYQGFSDVENNSLHLPYSENDTIDLCLSLSKNPSDGTPTNETQDLLGNTLVYGYEDGVSTKPFLGVNYAQLSSTDSFSIGSDDCDVIIYRLRVYNRGLNDEEVLTEFIYDGKSGDIIKERDSRNYLGNEYDFEHNDITESNYLDFFDAISDAYPDLRFILIETTEPFTDSKDTKVSGTTVYHWYKGGRNIEDNWKAINAIHSGQGTSSNNYGAAARNLDIDMTGEDCVITSLKGDKDRLSNISLTPTSIPNRYFNIKVNVASSENANNALLQKRYNEYNPYKRPFVDSQKITILGEDNKLVQKSPKDTMEFNNCVVFIWEKASNPREVYPVYRNYSWQYLTNNNINFYAIGNIGDSKKTDKSRLTDPDDPFEFIVEIMDVNLPLCDFPLLEETTRYVYDDDGDPSTPNKVTTDLAKNWLSKDKMSEKDGSSYGWRYIFDKGKDAAGSKYKKGKTPLTNLDEKWQEEAKEILKVEDISDRTVADVCKQIWVDFYNTVTKTEKTITNISEEGSNYIVTYENGETETFADLVELRTKTAPSNWQELIGEKAVLDSIVYYSLFTTRYTMVDNRAKNTFWHYGKCDAMGNRKWDLCFDYDNDTALGIDNRGELNYRYGYEDTDLEDAGLNTTRQHVFREYDSTFFCRLVDKCGSKFSEVYNSVKKEHSDAWTSASLISQFDEWQDQFPERFWKIDSRKKYINSYKRVDGDIDTSEFLREMACGRKKYQRRQFERNQYQYMGIKYRDASMPSLYFRAINGGELDGTLTLPIEKNCYIATSSKEIDSAYIYRPQENETYVTVDITGTDIYKIWGTPWIKAIDNLGQLADLGTAALSKAAKLNSLDVAGSSTLSSLQLTENGPMQEVDLTNTSSLTAFTTLPYETDYKTEGSLGGKNGFETLPNLHSVKASGSGMRDFSFYSGSPIQNIILSSNAETLSLPKIGDLKTLNYTQATNLSTLKVVGGALNPQEDEEATVSDGSGTKITTKEIVMYYRTKNSLKTVELQDINWTLTSTSNDGESSANSDYNLIEYLYNIKDADTNPGTKLSGRVHFNQIDNISLAKYKKRWPDVVFTQDTLIQKWQVSFLGGIEPVYLEVNDDAQISAQPAAKKLPTDEFYYQFVHWYKKDTDEDINAFALGPVKITADTTFYAKFNTNRQQYQVVWYDQEETGKKQVSSMQVNYGEGLDDNQITQLENTVLSNQSFTAATYKLFKGWTKTPRKIIGSLFRDSNGNLQIDNDPSNPCGYKRNVIEIYALWDIPTRAINSDTDTKTLTAAELGKYIANNNIDLSKGDSSYVVVGDYLKIPLGFRMPKEDYFGKAPVYPFGQSAITTDGIKPKYSDITMTHKNKDWTLLIDLATAKKVGGVVFGCTSGGGGLQITETSQRYRINWYGKTYLLPTGNSPYTSDSSGGINSSGGSLREVIVLQHKKGYDQHLYVYYSNHYDDQIGKETLQCTSEMQEIALTVSAGGIQGGTIGTLEGLCKAEIFNCMLWEDFLLSEKDIETLLQWPKEDFYWVVANGKSYQDISNKSTALDLYCAQGFEKCQPQFNRSGSQSSNVYFEDGQVISFSYFKGEQHQFQSNGLSKSFTEVPCVAARWMNNRFYNAFPREWKAIMATAYVPCTYSYKDNGVVTSNVTSEVGLNVWLPSMYEQLGSGTPEGPNLSGGLFATNEQRYRAPGVAHINGVNEIYTSAEDTDPKGAGEPVVHGDMWKKNNSTSFASWKLAKGLNAEWTVDANYYVYRTAGGSENQLNPSGESVCALYRGVTGSFKGPQPYRNYHDQYMMVPCISIKGV